MKMIYDIADKPKPGSLLLFALQQMLAILSATIAVPLIIGNGLTPAAAMFGAGIGTLVYVFFTKRKSPVFLGSSFAFIGPMSAACVGAVSANLGLLGILIGAFAAAAIYVVLSFVVKIFGVGWIDKLMPPVVIGPTVAIIGLSLSANAIMDVQKSAVVDVAKDVRAGHVALFCGLVTLSVTMLCATFGNKRIKLIPFVCGIVAGYAVAAAFTIAGNVLGMESLKIIDFSVFENYMFKNGVSVETFIKVPDFVFVNALKDTDEMNMSYFVSVLIAYVPVAFVVFAEHIADHKNLSSVVGRDLLKDPGLSSTLLGDGIGSAVGAFFGGCPNTTYGESVACVAITKNASIITIIVAAIGCMLSSFFTPFVAFIGSIPPCVMGGVCIALYGFIAVSGFKMFQHVDLDNNNNLFVASVILVSGIGGLIIRIREVVVTNVAVALILGILTNIMLSSKRKSKDKAQSDKIQTEE